MSIERMVNAATIPQRSLDPGRPIPVHFAAENMARARRILGNLALSRRGRFLARVAQRRVDLDVEAARRLGIEIGVGAEAAGMDAVDGAEVVDLVDVAGDAERADDLARSVADELAASLEEQRTVGELGQRLHEGRLLLRLL